MKINPEDKDVGLDNFYAAIGSKYISGAILKETVEKGLGSKNGLGSKYFKYGTVEKPVKIGIIGTGDEGGVLIGALNPAYAQVIAIADIRPFNVYRAFYGDKSGASAYSARPGLMKIYGWADEETARENVKVYEDAYEDLLDNPDVEAVIIALPLHLHAEASVKAMRKGKHVLCEKLMAHSVHQCKEMARVSEDEDVILTIGHQRHYSVLYENAVELVKKNLIGRIHHIRAQWHRDNLPGKDSWQKPLPTDPQMQADLEEALANLARAEQEFNKIKQEAKGRIKDENTIKLLDKFDGELLQHPKEIAELRVKLAEIAKQASPDEALRKEHAARISALEKRLAAVNKTYLSKLGLDGSVVAKYDPNALKQRVEILSNQVKDAEIVTKAKDYGYRDREVGGHTVTALEELIRWRLWDRTGGGLMAELGSHQLDAAGIFISALRDDGKKAKPLSVTAVGGRHVFPHDRDIDDHVYCSFEYPAPDYDPVTAPEKKIVVSYSSINGNGFGGYGETVLGTKGTLILDREKEVVLLARPKNGKYENTTVGAKTLKDKSKQYYLTDGKAGSDDAHVAREALKGPISRGYTEEIEHLCWAIREKEKSPEAESEADGITSGKISVPLRCSAGVALADAVIALTTNIAIEAGKNGENCYIEFKEEWFDIHSDETPEGIAPDVNRSEYA